MHDNLAKDRIAFKVEGEITINIKFQICFARVLCILLILRNNFSDVDRLYCFFVFCFTSFTFTLIIFFYFLKISLICSLFCLTVSSCKLNSQVIDNQAQKEGLGEIENMKRPIT